MFRVGEMVQQVKMLGCKLDSLSLVLRTCTKMAGGSQLPEVDL